MNFDKPMIDLVREIRRRAPSTEKPGIKLANPDLFHELLELYHAETDIITRTLIKELFSMAGDPWPQALKSKTEPETRYTTKVYRGQTQLVATGTQSQSEPQKPQRIYRGQVVT